MKILPSKRTIICTEIKDKTTSSGLMLPEGEKGKESELGVVYAIGEGKLPMDIKVGDTIVFRRYTENKVFIESERFNFIDFKDIVGVVQK